MAEKELARNRATRAANRGVVTKIIEESEEILENDAALHDVKSRNRLKRIQTMLNEKMQLLKELDEKILAASEIDDIVKEIEEAEFLKMRIIDALENIASSSTPALPKTTPTTVAQGSYVQQDISIENTSTPPAPSVHPSVHNNFTAAGLSSLQNVTDDTLPPAPPTSPPPLIQHNPVIPTTQAPKSRLPKITLAKFRGEVTQFRTFWDTFESTVHANHSLTKIDKFNYLVSLLEGSASRAIAGLPITEENYDAAIDILNKRFGKPQQLISAHMDELLKISSCSTDKPSQLRYLYDKLSVNIRGLEALGVKSDQYGSLLIPIIMAKLPPEIRVHVARNTTQDVWDIESILNVIQNEIEAREISEKVKAMSSNSETKRPPFQKKTDYPTEGAFLVDSKQQLQTPKCVYCSGIHFSASCESVTDINARKTVLKRDRRCFTCLRKGHNSEQCDKTCRRCNSGKHHQSICFELNTNSPRNTNTPTSSTSGDQNEKDTENNGVTTATTNSENTNPKRKVLLQTAVAIAKNDEGTKSTTIRILFDNGSQRSYITDNLRSKLQLKSLQTEKLNLNTFGESKFRKQRCDVVNLRLQKSEHDDPITISALTFPVICSPLPAKVHTNYAHLDGLELADEPYSSGNTIDLLIGSDFYWDFVTGETKRGEEGPIAVNSALGWLLSGPISGTVDRSYNTHTNLIIDCQNSLLQPTDDDILANSLKGFWETESIGISDLTANGEGKNESFEIDVKRNGDRYEVKLPWKEDCHPSSNGYQLCESRLRSLHHRLRKDSSLLSEYDNIIQQQLKAGIVEEVPTEELTNKAASQSYYLPHLAVVRKDRETTKVRVVYDGSAKASKKEKSLNDCLQTGPNNLPHVFDMLANFRKNIVGLTADIEKAFLMVGIQDDQRDFLRFLWLDNPSSENPKIIHLKFTRLVFGLRPSPAILGETILHHLELHKQSDPEIAEILGKSFYVDDLLTGECNDEKALAIYQRAKKLMAEGGFNLRKWKTNSPELQREIAESESVAKSISEQNVNKDDDESYAKANTQGLSSNTPIDEDIFVKVLGMNWNTHTDEIIFSFSSLSKYASSLPLTKRSVLKVTAKIYDPMGFLSPLTVEMKILFQELCLEKTNWDTELKGESLRRWKSFLKELSLVDCYRIPRCYFVRQPVDIQLHGFSDASERAYAAVVYVRSTYSDGQVEVRLVASKSRVAPIKRQTIPRLELLGALILARLVNKLKSLGDEIPVTLWTDSMSTLCWIKNERIWKQYVGQRVDEIRRLTPTNAWRHCPGEINPADLPSRGLRSKELSSCKTWWNGPNFLRNPVDQWPEMSQPAQTEEDEIQREAIKNEPVITHSMVNTSSRDAPDHGIDKIIDIERFSSITNLLRVTAYVNRFINNLKMKTQRKSQRNLNELRADELKNAEILWINAVQKSAFTEELSFLKRNDSKSTPPIRVAQFGLFLNEDQTIRCKGRIDNASLPASSKFPILLPPRHPFVNLLVKQAHDLVKHSGINATLTTLRERLWILRGRETVKKIIRRCVVCRRYETTPCKPTHFADLPDNRVSEDPPFTHVGLDFAGPLYVNEPRTSSGNTSADSNKVYVCLFTCASTRAVHLELTRGLNVQDFLLAFRKFASRRGLPATIQSDNAKTFQSSSKEIRKIARSQEVWRYLANNQITWNFIVEKAPWWGGYWERLVRSIKSPIKKVIGRSTLSYDEMSTLLTEVEAVINARPLTYVYDDQESVSHPLTPSDLIYGRRISTSPNSQYYETVSTFNSLTRRLKHHRHLLGQITRRWRSEYLTSLREQAAKGSNARGVNAKLKVGDIVILKNDSVTRAFWKLGKVEELLPGRDGVVRAAVITVSRGTSSSNQRLRRPIQHLIPIEVKS